MKLILGMHYYLRQKIWGREANMHLLAICIPNYNRIEKLKRLVMECVEQIADNHLEGSVQLCISDDFSIEDPTIIINEIRNRYPNVCLIYCRNAQNMGMDYNFLNSVKISDSKYCWIIGNDDLPEQNGLSNVVSIIKNIDFDFLVTPFDIYDYDDSVIGSVFPLGENKAECIYNTSFEEEYYELLYAVTHNSGLFGFLSNVVFKRNHWINYENMFTDKMHSIFIQMYMNIQKLEDGALYLYKPHKIIRNYADEDVNISVSRISSILIGLNGVIDHFYHGDVQKQLKRVIVDAYISGAVWELDDESEIKKRVVDIESPKNNLYKKYYIMPEDRLTAFQNKEIMIYGSGNYGKMALKQIRDYCNVLAFIDSDSLKWNKEINGIKVVPPSKMYDLYQKNQAVMIVANHHCLESIINELLDNNISRLAIIT